MCADAAVRRYLQNNLLKTLPDSFGSMNVGGEVWLMNNTYELREQEHVVPNLVVHWL